MIKSAARWCVSTPGDFLRLLKNRYSASDTALLIWTYAALSMRSFFEGRPTGRVKTARVCGYRVSSFSVRTTLYLFKEIFIAGEYHFRTDGKDMTIMDCGANIGMATLFFKWRYPLAAVHAFEPDPKSFELLKKNVADNALVGVHLHNIAVGKEEGTADFFTNAPVPGSLRMSVNRKRAEGEHIRVPIQRLSDFIMAERTFLKIDTEGSETDIMGELWESGALRKVEELVIEYHHRIGGDRSELSEILSIIEKAGFEYQLGCTNDALTTKDVFQNVMIFCYRGRPSAPEAIRGNTRLKNES